MARLAIRNPMVVLEDSEIVVIARRDDLDNLDTANTQSYTAATGEYSRVTLYASWLKFRPWLTVVSPPREWTGGTP
jgi:hypothetical protein